MGCIFALFAGIFPRLALLILWIARPARIDAAFDTFLLPLLGIIFLPFATLTQTGHDITNGMLVVTLSAAF